MNIIRQYTLKSEFGFQSLNLSGICRVLAIKNVNEKIRIYIWNSETTGNKDYHFCLVKQGEFIKENLLSYHYLDTVVIGELTYHIWGNIERHSA